MIINEGRPGKKLPALTNPGVAGDLLTGKQLIGADGQIITGTMASVVQATPSISVSASGLITASATQSAGRVAAGTKSATKQLTTQAGKTVTPGRTQQTAVASGRYTTGTVYVAGDADLKAANIKKGINIFGVTGTMESKIPLSSFVVGGVSGGIGEFSISIECYDQNYPIESRSDIGALMIGMGRSSNPDLPYGTVGIWFWCTDTEAFLYGRDGEYDENPSITVDYRGWSIGSSGGHYTTYIDVTGNRDTIPFAYECFTKAVFIPKVLL